MDKLTWVTFDNVHGGFLGKSDKQIAEEDKIFKEEAKKKPNTATTKE